MSHDRSAGAATAGGSVAAPALPSADERLVVRRCKQPDQIE
ncbi:hypothetical protein [Streptomyces beijiangensis]